MCWMALILRLRRSSEAFTSTVRLRTMVASSPTAAVARSRLGAAMGILRGLVRVAPFGDLGEEPVKFVEGGVEGRGYPVGALLPVVGQVLAVWWRGGHVAGPVCRASMAWRRPSS